MTDRVTIHIENHIADVRLNRADKLNALDNAMFEGIVEAGEKLKAEKSVRAIVLSGEGKGFSAGLDLENMASAPVGGTNLNDRTHGECNLFQVVSYQWRTMPVPVIAAVHGVCIGGGLQIATGADIRIVAPDAKVSVLEMRWGLVPDMGGMPAWRNLVREDVFKELTFTNRMMTGAEAQELGLMTYVDENPHARAMAIATEIAGKNPDAIKASKQMINDLADQDANEILLTESRLQQEIIGTPNQMEAVISFMQKRAPNFQD